MKTRNIFLLALSAIFAAACHTWDEPSAEAGMESYGNQYIQETNVVTIDALKTQYKNAINNDGLEKISKPTQIKVIVTGNDEGSNLYKQLYVTDGTGSLYMSIDKSGIFSEAAVGQCMLIELEGLYIGGYGKQPEIGTFYHNDKKNKDQVGRMSRYTWQEHFKLISPVEGLSTKPVMLSTLQGLNIEKDCGKLVTLVGVKMEGADGKITFAPSNEADPGGGVSRKIEGMSNVVVRSSTYAKHAAMIMPTEKINVTGIASRYNSTWQIMPRTVDDITLTTGNEEVDPSEEQTIGTKDEPITVAKAIEPINSYEDGGTSPSAAIVKGKISKIDSYNSNYKSITYYISDDGSTNNQIQVYSGKGLNGADFAAQSDLKVGQVVIVKGTLKKYVNNAGAVIPEIDQSSELLSIEDGAGGGSDTPSGDVLNVSFADGQGDFTIDDKDLGGLTFVWKADTKGYMKASAYANNANNPAESWLVSPAFSLKNATAPVMTFNNACNYVKEGTITDHVKVMVFDGANWAEATIASLPDGASWTFVDSTVDLKTYAGKENVKIAFKYVSTSAVAPTWEIKTVIIK